MVWNGFSSVFSSENGSEWNSEFFFFRKWFGTEFWSFLFWKWFGKEFQSFIIENGLEWNGFSLTRNGSERNSEVFLFCETDGILKELPSVPSCFVFCRIIFLSENGNPNCAYSASLDQCSDSKTGFMLLSRWCPFKSLKRTLVKRNLRTLRAQLLHSKLMWKYSRSVIF
jgi:hypothetical protein